MPIDRRFSDALNFRDLGGLCAKDGRKVKEGIFYRGAGLGYFNEEELKEFEKLHVKTIMDLRSRSEMDALKDPEIKGAHFIEHEGHSVSGSEDIDWSPQGMRKIGGAAAEQRRQIKGYYEHIAFGNRSFQIMMEEVKKGNVPLYFHCATGKDRTGMAAMILLSMLDVREEEIRKDYLASNIYRKAILEETLNSVADISKDHPEIAELLTLQDGVLEKSLDTVYASIKERYQTMDKYLEEEFGIDQKMREDLKDLYLC